VEVIHNALTYDSRTRCLSLVLPTVHSLMPSEYTHIFGEVFLNLYYFGADLRATLYRVWGKSPEARHHTGLLVMDRQTTSGMLAITKLMHAPRTRQPYGVCLPETSSVCGCTDGEPKWVFKTEKSHGREIIFIYLSSCCRVELQVGIYPGRRRLVSKFEATFAEEDWNPQTRSFDFLETRMVRMITFVSVSHRPYSDRPMSFTRLGTA
jgi:hypothetical protein